MLMLLAITALASAPQEPGARLDRASALARICDRAEEGAVLPAHEITGDFVQVSRAWLIDAKTACYDGYITAGTATWFEALETPADTLIIRSGGGNGAAGVVVGELMLQWSAEIVVRDHCFSSCAQIFLAAPRRVVPEPGVVGWHLGGLPWTRYEALQTRTARAVAGVDELADHAVRRLNRTGRNDVPDTVWRSLPERVRNQLETEPVWRRRIERLHALAGVRDGFHVAHNLVTARLPDFVRPALPAIMNGAAIFWTPDEATLRQWGFDDLIMWDADPETVLALGLANEPQTVNVRLEIKPGDFPLRPDPDWEDDAGAWPEFGR